MAQEILARDEIERIATQFVREEWGGEVVQFGRIWPLSDDGLIVGVEGMMRVYETSKERGYVCNTAECLFELQIYTRERKVTRSSKQRLEPPPPRFQPESIIIEPEELSSRRSPMDNILAWKLKEAEIKNVEAYTKLLIARSESEKHKRHR
jgi:hypothetical protein